MHLDWFNQTSISRVAALKPDLFIESWLHHIFEHSKCSLRSLDDCCILCFIWNAYYILSLCMGEVLISTCRLQSGLIYIQGLGIDPPLSRPLATVGADTFKCLMHSRWGSDALSHERTVGQQAVSSSLLREWASVSGGLVWSSIGFY